MEYWFDINTKSLHILKHNQWIFMNKMVGFLLCCWTKREEYFILLCLIVISTQIDFWLIGFSSEFFPMCSIDFSFLLSLAIDWDKSERTHSTQESHLRLMVNPCWEWCSHWLISLRQVMTALWWSTVVLFSSRYSKSI